MSPPETECPGQAGRAGAEEKQTHPVLLELQSRRREKLERYYLLRRHGNRVPALAPPPSRRPLVGTPRPPQTGWRLAHSAPEHQMPPPDPSGDEAGGGDRLRPTTASTRIPYHTAITRPPPPSRGYRSQFDALNRPYVPLPRLMDTSPPAEAYRKLSIKPWKEQVTRVVPRRPDFTHSVDLPVQPTSSPREAGAANELGPAYPGVLFYRSCRGRRRPGASREYVVSPDWGSETPRRRSLNSCALKYGWCA